jgi:hypothetical protein
MAGLEARQRFAAPGAGVIVEKEDQLGDAGRTATRPNRSVV